MLPPIACLWCPGDDINLGRESTETLHGTRDTKKFTGKHRIRIIPNICLMCKTDVLSSTDEKCFDLEKAWEESDQLDDLEDNT
jgi:hypothetical protein